MSSTGCSDKVITMTLTEFRESGSWFMVYDIGLMITILYVIEAEFTLKRTMSKLLLRYFDERKTLRCPENLAGPTQQAPIIAIC